MEHKKDIIGLSAVGNIKLIDLDSGSIILEKHNDINFEKLIVLIGQLLTGSSNRHITGLAIGNGGTIINSTGVITYKPTNTNGLFNQELYNQIFFKSINDASSSLEYVHLAGEYNTDIVIKTLLNFNDDYEFDGDEFVFDEIGISLDDDSMITHATFHPVMKRRNRQIQIIYTIRVTIGA